MAMTIPAITSCSAAPMGKSTVPNAKTDVRTLNTLGLSSLDPNGISGFTPRCPCGTDAYKKIYKQRTATERINNHILTDYDLHRMFIHTKEHYSFMTTMIGICIHLDARYKQLVQKAA